MKKGKKKKTCTADCSDNIMVLFGLTQIVCGNAISCD